ncbi:MAG: hypothetical protein ACJ8FS_16495 [Sphingomicrobium sp.]
MIDPWKSDDKCARCGELMDYRPGESYSASTDGRVWHYGCAPSRNHAPDPIAAEPDTLTVLATCLEAEAQALTTDHPRATIEAMARAYRAAVVKMREANDER